MLKLPDLRLKKLRYDKLTQNFKRGTRTKLFLTLKKTTIEKIRFATSTTVLNSYTYMPS